MTFGVSEARLTLLESFVEDFPDFDTSLAFMYDVSISLLFSNCRVRY